ncbi:hypothetical protein [Chryseobacterium oryctis]|uniref:Natural product n=1 Tax=Chryseobacterium oryctis TaxID=2952618 RepID=A0ABT3HQE7_9FLAO|nr:hypothetical protein [Chryseobacterium oryctis]MCW3161969.1 hypothetical protein [Chryseobacterium oryctis]
MKKLKRNSLKTILGGKLDCRCNMITYWDGSTSGGPCATDYCSEISISCGQPECRPTLTVE